MPSTVTFRCRERTLLLIPVLVIVTVGASLLLVRRSNPEFQSRLEEQETAVKGGRRVARDEGDDGEVENAQSNDAPEGVSDAVRDSSQPQAWEAKALAALRSKTSGSDPRRAFKLIQTFSALLPRISEVVRMPVPSREVFRGYIARAGLPVVFTGMFDGQPLRKWTWELLKERYGQLVYRDVRQGQFLNVSSAAGKAGVNRVGVKLADFIDVVTGARKPKGKEEEELYIAKKQLLPPEEVMKVFPFPPFFSGDVKKCFTEPSSW